MEVFVMVPPPYIELGGASQPFMWFAVAVALLAAALFEVSCRTRRWLEAGICAGSAGVCLALAYAGGRGVVPLWLLLWAGSVTVVLVALAAVSAARAYSQTSKGEAR